MSYKKNERKHDRICEFGQTVDLPLFEQSTNIISPPVRGGETSDEVRLGVVNLPDWIWDGSSIKAEIYSELKEKFAEDSLLYLQALIKLGGKATDNEVKQRFNDVDKWPLHIVAARRNYWTGNPYHIIQSFPDATKLGPHNRKNTIWYVNFKNLYLLIKGEA